MAIKEDVPRINTFFIDYQLAHSFEQESNELLKSSKDHKVSPAFEKTLLDIKQYYEFIKTDDLNEESKALSLKEYLALLQNCKQNLA
ncbi:hypothetical protein [Pisciglobus halotolerans]|uniref:hypothetical protein n=1 Tax=Pisciglobus halotolerans TaxID=745365 RepID=UPI000B80DA8E|nr:hypothetical protein [Pisciglobus halotolerans]